jgi:hypothetical protein
VQCSAVQCSAVQCSAVQCSTVQCSAVQYSAIAKRGGLQCSGGNYGQLYAGRATGWTDVMKLIMNSWRWMGLDSTCTCTQTAVVGIKNTVRA